MKTYVTKPAEIVRKWYLIDGNDVVLGRLSTNVADLLRGKRKAHFSPSVDCGDFVVVINASQIKTTGNKEEKKKYYRHSWYPGGLKEATLREVKAKDDRMPLFLAVKGMLPKNKLQNEMLKRLKIYSGSDHPHTQKLEEYKV
ncbi:50S ribosomal protein L13 [bacterium CG2_30_37_16]|nr:MAG: 50S ribosomal protein L13 [bacterium CG2_30_37_16]PIP30732.1 MAG: 50S ribosomal protein L13 [bacterium (Candidatus Howlettbacteria) CG23_combo_of_CG06-09_8_20_14_all_37_9]PIX99270.1 MAG: 50S ribosomal protein L13 [bacterium (Candidatus Howlettbacteria) CG_4_10_14_3_um_filter_37_10]PJB05587.1 MAG: 50S ribosomal protein L13 [bacterium (Candidatus Howlettbacteria) CG_4_9_14_3_um_filter_37_10]